MNEDYLWDKSGSDAEIEQLEKALSAFRHETATMPPVPVKFAPSRSGFQLRTFGLRFAAAFCTVTIVAGGMWSIYPESEPAQTARQSERIPAALEIEKEKTRDQILPAQIPSEGPEITAAAYQTKKRVVRNKALPAKVKNPKVTRPLYKESQTALTSEERFAYDQVRLALSISGSKLKIVRQTIDGTEEPRRTDRR